MHGQAGLESSCAMSREPELAGCSQSVSTLPVTNMYTNSTHTYTGLL